MAPAKLGSTQHTHVTSPITWIRNTNLTDVCHSNIHLLLPGYPLPQLRYPRAKSLQPSTPAYMKPSNFTTSALSPSLHPNQLKGRFCPTRSFPLCFWAGHGHPTTQEDFYSLPFLQTCRAAPCWTPCRAKCIREQLIQAGKRVYNGRYFFQTPFLWLLSAYLTHYQ